jgi:two-component system, OmpR family, sensor histidine kinase KdpD
MPEGDRLTPEEAIKRLDAETALPKARFKIFFGMSAGVGKTYAMLKEAHLLIDRGQDVAIGWVEAHGRAETDALLEGIPKVAPREVSYRGITMREMNLDAIIARRPHIVLVDELAHTNAPGSLHPKRFQDVLELLDAGISVYTTINIQHLESMADSVELVTLIPVRERVPDSVFDRADEIQLVDIPPEELINRLEEGKVYTGDASREAVRNFFTRSNLAVLREIALGQASQLASHQLIHILRDGSSPQSSLASLRLLVAVSPSPNSENLIRWTRRLMYSLKADAFCLHIESGADMSEKDEERLQKNLDLARSLGIPVETAQNADVAAGIVSHARERDVSIIVVGKQGLGGRRILGGPSLTERIIMGAGEIAVFAVQDRRLKEPLRRRFAKRVSASPGWQYLASILAVLAVTGLNFLIAGYVGYWAAAILYLAMISLLGLILERKPIFVAAALSAFAWDFLFIPPRFTLYIERSEDYLMLALYFVLALSSGWATAKLKANQRMLGIREKRISLLRDLASTLAGKSGIENILEEGRAFIASAFNAQVVFSLGDKSGSLSTQGKPEEIFFGDGEESAAMYCYGHDEPSGRGTATLPTIAWHFVPMDTPNGIIGVVGIKRDRTWTDEQELFLQTITRTVSLAVERELFAEENRANALSRESERLSKLILDSVSHEFRTPIAVIKGNASVLCDPSTLGDAQTGAAVAREIKVAAERLDAIVENLLSMSRLEAGSLSLRKTIEEAEDLFAAALAATADELEGRDVEVSCPDGIPPLACDAGLMVQVFVNLLRNAARHSGIDSKVSMRVRAEDGWLRFEVSDDGPGVREEDRLRLFDKFFRAANAKTGGTGLGLSICKGVVAAHGGRIEARNLTPHGLSISFSLPAGEASS